MYALSQSKIQAAISKEFVGVREKQLSKLLKMVMFTSQKITGQQMILR